MIVHGEMVLVAALLCVLSRRALTCLAVVTVNWLACCAWVLAFEDYTPLAARYLFDGLAAVALLVVVGGRARAALILSFCAQMVAHLGYGVRLSEGAGVNPEAYSDFLSIVSRLQLLFIGGWGVVNLWRRFVPDFNLANLLARKARTQYISRKADHG